MVNWGAGATGAVTGATAGSVAGPIGTVGGAILGGVGGLFSSKPKDKMRQISNQTPGQTF
jgi:hypothetical protein